MSSSVNIRIGDEDAVVIKVGRQVYTLRDGETTENPFEALTPLQRRMLEMRLRHWADKARVVNPGTWQIPGTLQFPDIAFRRGGIQHGGFPSSQAVDSALLASGGWCAPSETLYTTDAPLSLDDMYQDVWGSQTGSAQHPASQCVDACDYGKDFDEDHE